MKPLRTHIQQWAVSIVIGLVLVGYPLYGQAMSLFMGGDEPKQAAPPPKPAAVKPQPASAQPGAKAAVPGTGAPAPTVPGASVPAANVPKPVTAPISSLPAPATGVTGQPGQGGSTPAPVSKPVTAQSPATPIPPAQAVGSVKEIPKPATSTEAPSPPVAAAVPAPPLAEAADGYTYDPKSRREPFQSLTRLVKIDKTRMEMPPLQRVQLSDLKLLGIMWGGYGYYGLVRTPDGKGYTVKEGMLMGTNNGVISAITDKAVIVSEPSIDISGNKSTKDVEILLRPKEVS
jgi:Tfp pilus assembly protein PilP